MAMIAKEFIKPDEFKQDLGFTEADLNSSMQTQAGLFAHYAVQNAKAQHQVDQVKILLEVKEAKVAQKIREDAAESGAKITEKAIEQELATNVELIEVRKALAAAKAHAEVTKGVLEAFRQRKDMMVQIAAARRDEMQGEIRIRTAIEGDADRQRALRERALKAAQA